MASNARLLSINDRDVPYYNESAHESGSILESDKEVHPDQLSDDHGEGHGNHGDKKATILGSALNIANTIMGAGILALPNVIRQFGVVLGSSIIVIACVLTYTTCVLLLKAKNLSRHSKYISIGKHCFGDGGLWAVKAIIILNNVGLCIAYLIIFATVAQNLLQGFVPQCKSDSADESSDPVYCQQWLLTLGASVLVTPFVYARSMAKLQGASAIAVLAAGTFSIVTIEHFISTMVQGTNPKDVHFLPDIENIVEALSSITSVFLAFTFQFNFFPVYKSLQNPTDGRMKQTVLVGFSIVLFVYLSVANAGYLTFGDDTTKLLKNFTKDKMGVAKFIIVNAAFLLSSTLTLPLMFFGAKNEIYGAIKLIRRFIDKRKQKVQPLNASDESEIEVEEDEKAIDRKYGFKGFAFNLYVTILFGIIVFLAIRFPKINQVFTFIGSTAANGLNFLLPTLFYLRLSSKKGKFRAIAAFILVFGAVMGIVGIVTSIMSPPED